VNVCTAATDGGRSGNTTDRRALFHAHTTHSATGALLLPGHVSATTSHHTGTTRTLPATVSGVNLKRTGFRVATGTQWDIVHNCALLVPTVWQCRQLSWQPSPTNRAFPVVGPRTWNDLLDDVTSAESLSTFRQRLKTHLFTKSFFWLFRGLDFT